MNDKLSREQKQELISDIREAEEAFAKAWEDLAAAVRELGDENAKAYILEPLQILIFKDHGFMSRDRNIEQLADYLEEALDDEVPEYAPHAFYWHDRIWALVESGDADDMTLDAVYALSDEDAKALFLKLHNGDEADTATSGAPYSDDFTGHR